MFGTSDCGGVWYDFDHHDYGYGSSSSYNPSSSHEYCDWEFYTAGSVLSPDSYELTTYGKYTGATTTDVDTINRELKYRREDNLIGTLISAGGAVLAGVGLFFTRKWAAKNKRKASGSM
ncbi:MAG: hypothetical protein LBQ80_04545 [Clostridium sp.]|nr:hypothetical protein [Clostridium sp.]